MINRTPDLLKFLYKYISVYVCLYLNKKIGYIFFHFYIH